MLIVAAWLSVGRDRAISLGAVSAYGERYAFGAVLGAVEETSLNVLKLLAVSGGRDLGSCPWFLLCERLLRWLPWLLRLDVWERASSTDLLRPWSSMYCR